MPVKRIVIEFNNDRTIYKVYLRLSVIVLFILLVHDSDVS